MPGRETDGDGAREAQGGGDGAAAEGDLSARLKRLDARIERTRPSAPPVRSVRPDVPSGPSPLGQAMRLSSEFVAGVLAGAGLGWALDRALGTRPWGLIGLLLLGFGAGIYNVMRATGPKPGPAGGADDTGEDAHHTGR